MSGELTPDQVRQAEARAAKESAPHKAIVGFDQFLNDLGFQWLPGYTPDQTMSSHFQIAADQGHWFGKAMTKFLHVFQRKHGKLAAAGDLERAEQAEEAEEKDLGVKDE